MEQFTTLRAILQHFNTPSSFLPYNRWCKATCRSSQDSQVGVVQKQVPRQPANDIISYTPVQHNTIANSSNTVIIIVQYSIV